MKFATSSFAVVLALLVCAANVSAQPNHIEYDFSGTGNLMVSPVVYGGSIDAGEPLLVGGTWSISVNDAGWPSDADQAARWNYVNTTYFAPNFDPFIFAWAGIFDNSTTGSSPVWTAGRGDVGNLVGTASVQLTIQDFDFDQVIDPDERGLMLLSGTIIVVKNGTGIWAGYCGLGSYSGFTTNPDPVNFADDVVSGSAVIDIEDCSVATDVVTWGNVKDIYAE